MRRTVTYLFANRISASLSAFQHITLVGMAMEVDQGDSVWTASEREFMASSISIVIRINMIIE